MTFRITGLSPEPFRHLYGLSDQALAAHSARRLRVDEEPGFPDRIEMREGRVGEIVLLLNHCSLDMPSPYRASHAIFVLEGAEQRYDCVNEIPDIMRRRLLSVRAFSESGFILEADVVEGTDLRPLIDRFFLRPDTAFLHVHNARQGCYSGRIDRL